MSIGRDNPPSRPAGFAENKRGMVLARGCLGSTLGASSFLLAVALGGVGAGLAGSGTGIGAGGTTAAAGAGAGGLALFHF